MVVYCQIVMTKHNIKVKVLQAYQKHVDEVTLKVLGSLPQASQGNSILLSVYLNFREPSNVVWMKGLFIHLKKVHHSKMNEFFSYKVVFTYQSRRFY